jgi:response regulator RpfG family c-di-GMP phosphodiesterase
MIGTSSFASIGTGALVLIVDPDILARHWMWRALSRAFGVLEAATADGARRWLEERPDIDALVVADALPDRRGSDLVDELRRASHPIASRAILLAPPGAARRSAHAILVDRDDVRAVLTTLASWFRARV